MAVATACQEFIGEWKQMLSRYFDEQTNAGNID
jgi:hypothetical protein